MRRIINKILGRSEPYNKTLKTEVLDKVQSLLEHDAQVIFDIGAHHGRFAEEAASCFPKSKIYCFEPSPASFQALRRKLVDHSFALNEIALSDRDAEMDFYLNEFDETNSLLPSVTTHSNIDHLTKQKEVIKVKVTTLDNYCSQNKIATIDLLKIDVQGNTLNALKGASQMLTSKRIKIIYCEVEFLPIYANQALFHEVTSFLQGFQYTLYSLYNIHYDVNDRISWADALYFLNENDQHNIR